MEFQGIKFYDPSYGIESSSVITQVRDLLNEYAKVALEGVLYAKDDSNGQLFIDHYHSKGIVDVLRLSRLAVPGVLHKVCQEFLG